ncbi:MAG: HAD-IA family hydrolase [Pseudodesulfovibrio sp.]|uniref:HAD-superfamily hydrolase, subfamily IA, variant 3 n=1 Tax=Pseudodesulfovibrio aespoeensis (strain ATCC 700646 / DSM 10631 / Aspo-2) TaxID=643562 RepID=E6VVI5_PSEA9|nr:MULTISPECIES: HAD-IA family hydrolase [Pseudodesulfovibrio]ADU63543.1 HAD-superfamily hydrolase, subfamily IA, variant 3 [Pseudodesulfovibrio aespoeensis Aspo-2]MBV1772172.1 HAD-IA family hydrolase [Pseudodesulfovibrio sp.]
MSLEAIIWDVDGTLVDSEELHRAAFNTVFDEYGLDCRWSRKAYSKLLKVTGGKERIRYYAKLSGMEKSFPSSIEDMHARKTEIYHESIRLGKLHLRNGVKEILNRALEKGIRLAIATTTSMSNVEALFSSGVLQSEHWEIIVSGEHVTCKKPAPDVYLEVLRRLELDPMDCIAVEDSENGMESAVTAGVPTIITTNGYTRYQEFGKEIALVHCLKHGLTTLEGLKTPITINHFEAWHAAARHLVKGRVHPITSSSHS